MTEILETCRAVNPVLVVLAVMLAAYRMGETMMARPVQDRQLGLIFLTYVFVTGLGAIQARLQDAPIGPVSGILTILHVLLILRMATWRVEH